MTGTLNYLIIGSGRIARHLHHYLSTSPSAGLLSVHQWNRKEHSPELLPKLASQADRILLALSDNALELFLSQNPFLKNLRTVHFSGSLYVDGIQNAHPLASFGPELLPTALYAKIHWATFKPDDFPAPALSEILPCFAGNPNFVVPNKQKALYHALAVVSGNFTTILWQEVQKVAQQNFPLPDSAWTSYFETIGFGLQQGMQNALTGPLARKEHVTVEKHLAVLSNTNLNEIYRAFLHLKWPEFNSKDQGDPPC